MAHYLADAPRGLILPLDPGQPVIPGTGGVANLSLPFHLGPSGIAIPYRPPKQPKDLLVPYMSPGDIGLSSLPLSAIDDGLQSIPLDAALTILARLADYADRLAGSSEGQAKIAETFLPYPFNERAKAENRRTGHAVIASQLALLLARRALATCSQPDSYEWDDGRLARTAHLLGVLTLVLVSTLGVAQTPEETALDISRAQHFSMRTSKWDFEDAHEVLFKALPEVPGASDLDQIVHDRLGVTLRSLWAVAALTGMAFANEKQSIVQPILNSIEPHLKQAFLDLWSLSPAAARAAWTSGDTTSTPWDLSAFYKKPMIDFGPHGACANIYTPVRTAFMVGKAQLADTLWIAADLMPEASRRTLLSHTGVAFESTVRRRIQCRFTESQLLTEDDLKARRPATDGGRVCDLVVLYPRDWVAFEFVRHTLTRRTLTVGDYADLMKDLRAGAVEKLGQIDETIWRLLADHGMSKPARVFSVVVIGGQLSINPITWEAILSALAEQRPKSLTVDRRCMRPVILDLVDLRLAFAATDQLTKTLPQVLAEFIASALAAMPFAIWLADAYPQVDPAKGASVPDWVADAAKWSGLSTSPQS